jgi:hypothetical protein
MKGRDHLEALSIDGRTVSIIVVDVFIIFMMMVVANFGCNFCFVKANTVFSLCG